MRPSTIDNCNGGWCEKKPFQSESDICNLLKEKLAIWINEPGIYQGTIHSNFDEKSLIYILKWSLSIFKYRNHSHILRSIHSDEKSESPNGLPLGIYLTPAHWMDSTMNRLYDAWYQHFFAAVTTTTAASHYHSNDFIFQWAAQKSCYRENPYIRVELQ